MYWSTTAGGRPVRVSGVVYRPTNWFRAGPGPIIAWAHGTYGLGAACTTETYFARPCRRDVIDAALQHGATFVATDYEGLGARPAAHPYLVSSAAGRNVLDSIRAANELVHANVTPSAVVVGWSQGGGAACFAAELAHTYAADVDLRGVVAVAPVADLNRLVPLHDGGPRFGYLLMAARGFPVAYPQLRRYDRLLNRRGRQALARIGHWCVERILGEYAGRRGHEFGVTAVLTSAGFQRRLTENSPGGRHTDVPILLIHGSADDTIPVDVSRRLARNYAAVGVSVTTRVYPGAGHPDVFDAATADIDRFVSDRLRMP